MPEWLISLYENIVNTPPDRLMVLVLYIVGPFMILSVMVWGATELWIARRQAKYVAGLKWKVLHISVPKDTVQTPKGIENFFSIMIGAKGGINFKDKWLTGKVPAWFSFEIVSRGGRIGFYVYTQEKFRDAIEAAMYAQYPEASIVEVEDYAQDIPTEFPSEDWGMWGSEMILKNDTYLPIKTYELFEHQGEKDNRFKDPLLGLLEALGSIGPTEHFYFQLIISPPDDQGWTKDGQKFVNGLYGKSSGGKKKGFFGEAFGWFFEGLLEQSVGLTLGGGEEKKESPGLPNLTPFEKEQADAVSKKISKIGWLSKIRLIYWAPAEDMRTGNVAGMVKGIMQQYTHQGLNGFTFHGPSTPQDDYFWQEWGIPATLRNISNRYKSRSLGDGATPSIMNVEELATFWHFPSADARTPVLTTIDARQAEAPVELNFAASDAPVLQNLGGPGAETAAKALPARGSLSVPKVGQNRPPEAPVVAEVPDVAEAAKEESRLPEPELSVPKPVAPGAPANPTQQPAEPQIPVMPQDDDAKYKPQPGKPAPLPPGLDLNDQSLPPID